MGEPFNKTGLDALIDVEGGKTKPSGCTRCGQCCTMAFIGLHSIKKGEDKQEFAQWLAYHQCGVRWMQTDESDQVLLVKIPIVCKHLSYNNAGIASCKIYEDRPRICRDHLCGKLRNG